MPELLDNPAIRIQDPCDAEGRDFGLVLDLARRGDEGAWALLVEAYEPGLRKAARERLGPVLRPELDAEDIVQSVHWSLWVGLRRGKFELESVEDLLAIGRVILRRKIARAWRSLERRKRITSRILERYSRGTDPADADPSADDAARQVSADDQFERLCRIMTRTERRLIELRMLGCTTAEAAREMGRDSECLRVTLARLRKKLEGSGLLPESPPSRRGSNGRHAGRDGGNGATMLKKNDRRHSRVTVGVPGGH